MSPAEALKTLRSRGFEVRVDDGALVVTGPPARNADAAEGWLRDNWAELGDFVRIEQHPFVQLVQNVFPDARLVEVRGPKEVDKKTSPGTGRASARRSPDSQPSVASTIPAAPQNPRRESPSEAPPAAFPGTLERVLSTGRRL